MQEELYSLSTPLEIHVTLVTVPKAARGAEGFRTVGL